MERENSPNSLVPLPLKAIGSLRCASSIFNVYFSLLIILQIQFGDFASDTRGDAEIDMELIFVPRVLIV